MSQRRWMSLTTRPRSSLSFVSSSWIMEGSRRRGGRRSIIAGMATSAAAPSSSSSSSTSSRRARPPVIDLGQDSVDQVRSDGIHDLCISLIPFITPPRSTTTRLEANIATLLVLEPWLFVHLQQLIDRKIYIHNV